MLCHYCGYAERVPSLCPKCKSEHIYFLGLGSERVEDELHREFPEARIARMDRDTVSGKRHFETILTGFRERALRHPGRHADDCKGTRHSERDAGGVISADIGLGMPDFRAAERTFQLLTQVAGRAGRGQLPGQVLMQTINPDHYAIGMRQRRISRLFTTRRFIFERRCDIRRSLRWQTYWCEVRNRRTQCA